MTVPAEEVKVETTPEVVPEAVPAGQEIPSTETTEVKNTEETPVPATEISDDDVLMNFFKGLTPADDKATETTPTPTDAPKDEFHGAENSEPAALKKANEALTTELTTTKTALNEAKPFLDALEKDPALKSLVNLVMQGKSTAKLFAEFTASQAGPATKTDGAAPAGNPPVQDNSPMGLVRRTLPRIQATKENGQILK